MFTRYNNSNYFNNNSQYSTSGSIETEEMLNAKRESDDASCEKFFKLSIDDRNDDKLRNFSHTDTYGDLKKKKINSLAERRENNKQTLLRANRTSLEEAKFYSENWDYAKLLNLPKISFHEVYAALSTWATLDENDKLKLFYCVKNQLSLVRKNFDTILEHDNLLLEEIENIKTYQYLTLDMIAKINKEIANVKRTDDALRLQPPNRDLFRNSYQHLIYMLLCMETFSRKIIERNNEINEMSKIIIERDNEI
ncbi:MAG: hypothetical protein LBI81_01770 [Puniceicoccales bacterium]|jgi:hypothetical protein|nr:hypothetical protein [Puniceicoccales bacterium]